MKEISVSFKNQGQKISGILHLPDNPTDSCVVIVHGFSANKFGPGNSFVKLAEELTKNGIAALRFNFRFTTEDLSEFQNMTISGEVKDLKIIIDRMAKDFKKIGLVGESFGDSISILAYDKRITSIVFWYPPVFIKERTLRKYYTKEQREQLKKEGFIWAIKFFTNQKFKIGKKFVEECLKTDLKNKIKQISCPTLVVHGDKDTDVELEESLKLMELLKCEKKLEIIKGMGHAFKDNIPQRNPEFIDKTIKLTVYWFNKWLK